MKRTRKGIVITGKELSKSILKKTALRIELPDGSETVVNAFDPPNLKLFPAKKRGRK